MTYRFKTQNTCSQVIEFNIEGNVVTNVRFLGGGCPGNLQALPRLVEGMTVEEIEEKIGGIDCGGRGTSCADQLARAVREAYEQSKKLVEKDI